MNSCELVTFVSSVACAMAKNYTKEELTIMATVLTQLGYTLETILTNNELCGKDTD